MFRIGDVVVYQNYLATVIGKDYTLALSDGTTKHHVPEAELKPFISAIDIIKSYEVQICKLGH